MQGKHTIWGVFLSSQSDEQVADMAREAFAKLHLVCQLHPFIDYVSVKEGSWVMSALQM